MHFYSNNSLFFLSFIVLIYLRQSIAVEQAHQLLAGLQNFTFLSSYNISVDDILTEIIRNRKILTPECSQDLIFTIQAIVSLSKHAVLPKNHFSAEDNTFTLPLLDSWAKFPAPGIMKGNTRLMGLLTECQNVKYRPLNWSRSVEGQYYRVFFGDKPSLENNLACAQPLVSLDICLPRTCENDDLTGFARKITLNITSNPICLIQSVNQNVMKADFGTYFIGIFMVAILILCLGCSLFDYFHEEGYFQRIQQGSLAILRSFSLHRNVIEVLSTETLNQTTNFLNCIRFFSICWVICGHIFGFNTLFSSNPSEVLHYVHSSYLSNFVVNSFFAVDSFFLLAGLLVSYTWFKVYNKNASIAKSGKAWAMFYVHRLLRITPLYYIVLLFFTFLLPLCYSNMPVLLIQDNSVQKCQQNFWVNMLYLQNFVNGNPMCFGVTWFLATEFQMFIFSPFLLMAFTFGLNKGAVLTTILLLISTATTAILVGVMDLPPTFVVLGKQLLDPKIANEYRIWVYTNPLTRCPPYLIGMLLGYMMQNKRVPKVNRILNLMLWVVSLLLMIVLVLCGHIWNREVERSIVTSVLYNTLSRLFWSLALAWIIVSCYNRQGGPIGALMNWSIWGPLGRLSYAAYLLHFPLIGPLFGAKLSQPIFRNGVTLLLDTIIPFVLFTFLLSLFVSAIFEIPFSKLEAIILPRARTTRVAIEKTETSTLEENFTEEERNNKIYL